MQHSPQWITVQSNKEQQNIGGMFNFNSLIKQCFRQHEGLHIQNDIMFTFLRVFFNPAVKSEL